MVGILSGLGTHMKHARRHVDSRTILLLAVAQTVEVVSEICGSCLSWSCLQLYLLPQYRAENKEFNYNYLNCY